ncbi:hypothetical protein Tco_1256173 [Tanacetum coccineum]
MYTANKVFLKLGLKGQVTHTAKVSKLIDEDVEKDNDGHGDITSNGILTLQSVKNKANTSSKDAGLLEQDNGE